MELNLAQINHAKNIFEKLFFKNVINSNFTDIIVATKYLEIINMFLKDSLNFKDMDIDAVEIYKRKIGWYGRAENFDQIARELNKQPNRIQDLYIKSSNKLNHPIIVRKLMLMLIKYLYCDYNKPIRYNIVNWRELEKIAKDNPDFMREERIYFIKRIEEL